MIKIYGKIPKVKSDILNFKNLKEPTFATYKPKLEEMKKIAQNYKKFKNVIVIGNGGSINNFRAISKALDSNKKIFLADTMEPKILEDISRKCLKNDTVIISVSKSGNTIGVLEDLIYFINRGYKNFVSVTGGGALKEISKKMNFPIIDHPNISGRFSGMTSCALFPSAVCGFDIKKIYNGSKTIYSSKKIKSKIFSFANTLFFLEKNGYDEIFMPIYSELLSGFSNLIKQLIHETTGKKELGQTIISAIGPESQHHTNQRFFGGPKNILGLFINVKKRDNIKIRVPKKLKEIKLKDGNIKILDKLDLSDAIQYEFEGVIKTTSEKKIPYIVIEIDKINEKSVGALMAIFQYLAYYSALVRNQNPFDQPEVERSKEMTFKLIKNLKQRN